MTQQINNSVLESNTSGHSSGLRLCSGTHHDCYIDLVVSLHKALTLQLKMTNCNISSDLDVHVRMNSYVIKSDIKSITSNICDTVLSNDQIHTDISELCLVNSNLDVGEADLHENNLNLYVFKSDVISRMSKCYDAQ